MDVHSTVSQYLIAHILENIKKKIMTWIEQTNTDA